MNTRFTLQNYVCGLKNRKRQVLRYVVPVLFLFCAMLSACKKDTSIDTDEAVSVYKILQEDISNFSFMRAAVDRAGLADSLNGNVNITVFAPVNQAFIDAGYANVNAVKTADPLLLRSIVRNHIVNTKIDLNTTTDKQEISSAVNQKIVLGKINFTTADTSFAATFANGANVLKTDVKATNGNIQVVNRLLIPNSRTILATLQADPNYSFLISAVTRASQGSTNFVQLLSGTSDYTLFAPTNAAFTAVAGGVYNSVAKIAAADINTLTTILNYHIVAGKFFAHDLPANTVTITPGTTPTTIIITKVRATGPNSLAGTRASANGVTVKGFLANSVASNGIIHGITSVLSVPSNLNTLQTINANTNLKFLSAAIVKASTGTTNFTQLLSGTSLNTVYAPTDAAFIAAGYANEAAVSNELAATLTVILNNNIFKGRIYGSSLEITPIYTFTALSGAKATVTLSGGYKILGNGNTATANVNPADITTTNGVYNVIDQVLRP
ncbi:fasciclin domain-containing protein [Mucilaginibacter terrae]|uniref:fasciclin domain-containing protein n=1 Tax=Mucilaginibacter terrae TaxID=1955052 RepID=UPI00363084E8